MPYRGRGPDWGMGATQCWVAGGLLTGWPPTRGSRRTPLVPATYMGRIAQAAIGTPAGDSCPPGSALSQTRPRCLTQTHGRRQRH